MKVFVTGSEGRIGSATCELLDDAVRFDRSLGDELFESNLVDLMKGCDAVVHLAAYPHPKRSLELKDYLHNNVMGTYLVASSAAIAGVEKFIYASSTSYYGFERDMPGVVVPAVETQAPATSYLRSVGTGESDLSYSISKVMAEQIVSWYGLMKKMRVTVLRFGPIGHWTTLDLAASSIVRALNLNHWYDVINVVEDGIVEVANDKLRGLSG